MKAVILPGIFAFCVVVVLGGCAGFIGMVARSESSTTVKLSSGIAPGAKFVAATHNGSITVTGDDADCLVTAKVTARAATEEKAAKLARETRVELVPADGSLSVKIQPPDLTRNESVTVSLDAAVPRATPLALGSHNGAIKVDSIAAAVVAATHNGGIVVTDVSGAIAAGTHNGSVTVSYSEEAVRSPEITATTHNGSIECDGVDGNVTASTHNGNIDVAYAKTAAPSPETTLVTHNGAVRITVPPNFDAKVFVSTKIGRITTAIPLVVKGELDRTVDGAAGAGKGKLTIMTHNGSVEIW
jgi:hypothetical protein